MFILWTFVAFALGALPFSVWVGRRALKQEITTHGDRNPGATNVLRAGGRGTFALALILDITKGAFPVGMAYYIWQWQDWRVVPIAIAAPAGHAFSPFLNWKGGRAIATVFGAWIGLTLWKMPVVSMLALSALAATVTPPGWAVAGTLGVMFATAFTWLSDPILTVCLAGHALLLIWTHRRDLSQPPRIRARRWGR